jgi:hypothetical protein
MDHNERAVLRRKSFLLSHVLRELRLADVFQECHTQGLLDEAEIKRLHVSLVRFMKPYQLARISAIIFLLNQCLFFIWSTYVMIRNDYASLIWYSSHALV